MTSHRLRKPGLWKRLVGRGQPEAPPGPRTVEVVDAGDLLAHQLTREAFDLGRQTSHYVARCGAEVLPAALVEPGRGYCPTCGPLPYRRSVR